MPRPPILSALLIQADLNPAVSTQKLSDDQVCLLIIKTSIASNPVHSACPYQSAMNGSACGGKPVYSSGGSYAPLYYPQGLTPQMPQQWGQQNGG